MVSQLIFERMGGGTPGMMEFGISGGGWNTHEIPAPRNFDEVDVLTGTTEADTFVVESLDQISFNPTIAPLDQTLSNPIVVNDEKGDGILIYQEKERTNYIERFQAPTKRSYTYIDNFAPSEDEILVDGGRGHVKIMPMIFPGCIEVDGEWFCF